MSQNDELDDECDEYPHGSVEFLLVFLVPINLELTGQCLLILLFKITAQETKRAVILVEWVVHAVGDVVPQKEAIGPLRPTAALLLKLVACCEIPVTPGTHLLVVCLRRGAEYFEQEGGVILHQLLWLVLRKKWPHSI